MGHTYNPRQVYNDTIRALKKAGCSDDEIDKAVLSQSYLRFEAIASTTVTNYKWAILNNDTTSTGSSTVRPTEQRLTLQDAFYIGQIQVLVGLAASAADTAFPLYSFPNPDIFTTAGAAAGLNNFYNGKLLLTVNNVVITPAWDLERHYYVPQTQNATGAASPINQFDGGLDGAFPCEPNLVMIGSKGTVLAATLPNAIPVLQAGSTTVLTIICRGILAQNITVVS